MKNEYEFPYNKWYLKIDDENRDLVNNWRINIIKYDNNPCEYPYICSRGWGVQEDSGGLYNWILITTEQFKKYVLNMEEEVKIGDIVKLITKNRHHYGYKYYDNTKTFQEDEIGIEIKILDIIKEAPEEPAYEVRCKYGIQRATLSLALKRGVDIFKNKKLNKTFKIIKYG